MVLQETTKTNIKKQLILNKMAEFEIVKKPLNKDQYYPRGYDKTQIWLHHTAGTTAEGAMDWWNQTPDHVGTAYVIDRDGTIYECFNPESWAYHLGRIDDDNYSEKHGVGIEIVAAGQLYERPDGKVLFYPLYPNKSAQKVIPENEVVRLKKKWRGHYLYHEYNDKQLLSLSWLVALLMERFNIPLQKDFKKMYEYDETDKVIKGKPGIYCHSTVRKDKTDMVPQPKFLKTFLGCLDSINKRNDKPKKSKGKKKIKS